MCHLASHFLTLKTKSFRAAEGGLWWPPAGLQGSERGCYIGWVRSG